MQSRRDKSCWQLFLNMLPSSNLPLLKTLCLGYLLLDHKAAAADDVSKYKFFSNREEGSNWESFENPCVQSYPGTHLAVMQTSKKGEYQLLQCKDGNNCGSLDLYYQLERRKFVGDSFCNGKLKTLKDSRTQCLKDKTFSNTNYEVDLSDPRFIEIELKAGPK